ncbi:MAG: type IX secretion system sortase PorU [Bacteroidales bacterium]|nr:type IX secretion system sortase PorU [Bacteroidales bacterium]
MKLAKSHILLALFLLVTMSLFAQWDKTESVLKDHTWYKIGVVENGIYALDQASLQAFGIDVQTLDPARVRLFGNAPGMLPEANAALRFDDLTEVAIQVEGAGDGSFDADDRILFYGHGPVNTTWDLLGSFGYERNSYTDTVYYFLCTDSDQTGLRITEVPAVNLPDTCMVIARYPDCFYHENEEISPYASGRRWYGDMITPQEGSIEFVFDIPDLIQSEVLRFKSRILGRCPSRFGYNMEVNDNILADHVSIAAYGNLKFGTEHEVDKMCYVDSDQVAVKYSINPTQDNPMLYIDYFAFTCWRKLKFRDAELAFSIVPMQYGFSSGKVLIEDADPTACCWDVTDPIHPYLQPLTQEGEDGVFGVKGAAVKRYHLFTPTATRHVASCYPVHNQNLHAITDAEMLVISPSCFWEQAETLAEYHRQEDHLDCLVVDINEIYNEFGTGTHDPTAMRDFIRMVYLRSEGRLRYVLLMGKGTHDYRDIKGFGNNYVPTYENTDKPWYEVGSICTDDYFAIMDVVEGEGCSGRVDIGMGRIPITTPEQGDDMIQKIKHYNDLSQCYGPWKTTHFFLADNDSRTYMSYCEDLERIIDTGLYGISTKKLYADSYPVVSTPSGTRIPKANEALLKAFDEGMGVLSYTGHGGVKGLMEELVITTSDILAMDNYDKLPFVHTATCEFSKFDNPNLVSAGEQMLLNPNGGAIAMLTTVRPTQAINNQMLSKALHKYVYEREDHQPMRFGDIVRLAKSDSKYYSKNNIGYFLFGDPALRLGSPRQWVSTLKINGQNANEVQSISAATKMTVEGYITLLGTKIDTSFNGVVEVRLYDKKTKFSTLGLHFDPVDYSFYNDILFEGKATVSKGKFSIQIQVPYDVNYCAGNALLSYYAYDSIRGVDAADVYDKLKIVDADPATVLDSHGPDIHLYWNSPDFESGDVGSRHGVLCADLFDEQGIYHYNVSIGRDITLNSSVGEYDGIVLNDRYEPALDDYRKGRVQLAVNDLSNGSHTFKLKAWDTQDNVSEVEVVLVVEDGILLAEVHNTPNPFTEGTYFSFLHGDKTEPLSVTIEVFDMLGRRVSELRQETSSTAGVVPPIYWNGRSYNGQRLKAGVYVYRLSVTGPDGKTRAVSSRMLIG